MPIDSAPVATRVGKPRDLRRPVADRDQKHPTASAATQADTRDLAKWHIDHAAYSQPVHCFPPWERWSMDDSPGDTRTLKALDNE
jgi:hypothetical protein